MQVTAGLLFALARIVAAAPKPGVNDCGEPYGMCYNAVETPKAVVQRAATPPSMAVMALPQHAPTIIKGKDGWMTILKKDGGKMTALQSDTGFMTAWEDDGKIPAPKYDTGFMTAWKSDNGVMTAWAPEPT